LQSSCANQYYFSICCRSLAVLATDWTVFHRIASYSWIDISEWHRSSARCQQMGSQCCDQPVSGQWSQHW